MFDYIYDAIFMAGVKLIENYANGMTSHRAVTLLELVRRREKTKKENLHLTADIFERRFTVADWDGRVIAEALAQRQLAQRVLQPAAFMNLKFDPELGWVTQQQQQSAAASATGHKRSYKKKKKSGNKRQHQYGRQDVALASGVSSDDDMPLMGPLSDVMDLDEADDGPFAFRRKRNCQYLAPLLDEDGIDIHRGWPWESPDDGGAGEPKYRNERNRARREEATCVLISCII